MTPQPHTNPTGATRQHSRFLRRFRHPDGNHQRLKQPDLGGISVYQYAAKVTEF